MTIHKQVGTTASGRCFIERELGTGWLATPNAMRIWMNVIAVTCLGVSSLSAQRIGPRDVDTLPSRPPQLRAAYGSDSLQVGELRLPSGVGPFPVAVVIHGGCWTKGFATLRNTAAVASALVDDGIATWNVEYRQAGDAGGGWPNTFLDVGAAVDYVRTLAAKYPLDLGRVVLIGHSAGAHLALWAAGRPHLASGSSVRGQNPLTVRAAVAIDGPGDLGSLVGADARICGKPVIAPLMGGTPATVPERYHDASPKEMLPLGVRQYLVSAAVLTPVDAQAYETAARARGDSATVLSVTTGGHFGVIAPGTPFWPPVHEFIRQAFGMVGRQ
jgi:pimeloyl-ACP methyl ester carboxylesterase